METIANILNLVECGLNAILGTGTFGCRPFFKKISSIWILPQGFELDPAETLDETYAQLLQAQGNLVVLRGVDTPTDEKADDTIDTSEDGIEQVANLGRYKFMFTFIKGLWFHAALHSLNSFGNFDVMFIDREGNILGTRASNGGIKGFTLGMLQGSGLQWATSAVGQREGISMQLLNRSEVDNDYVFIQREQLGDFNPLTLRGINEIVLSFGVVPANLDATITIDAIRAQDSAPFTGIDFSEFRMLNNDVVDDPTAGDDSVTAGTYVLTVTALATNDELDVFLYDQAASLSVVELDNRLYKSNTVSTVVVV